MKKSGQDVYITKELVDEVLAGIDDSYDRVKRFMAPERKPESAQLTKGVHCRSCFLRS